MQTSWNKIKNSIKDDDDSEDLYKIKHEEAKHTDPKNRNMLFSSRFCKI